MENFDFFAYAKILHLIAVFSWMAALFYLPRLFVYHCENFDNQAYTKIVRVQERKLINGIAHPAMIVSVVSGIALIWFYPGNIFLTGKWIHIKLLFVLFLIIFHFSCVYYYKKLEKTQMKGVFFRFFNEVPTILLIVIIVSVVLQFR